jgi:hypothetical protein
MWRLQQKPETFCAVIGKILCLLGIQNCRLVQARLTSIKPTNTKDTRFLRQVSARLPRLLAC